MGKKATERERCALSWKAIGFDSKRCRAVKLTTINIFIGKLHSIIKHHDMETNAYIGSGMLGQRLTIKLHSRKSAVDHLYIDFWKTKDKISISKYLHKEFIVEIQDGVERRINKTIEYGDFDIDEGVFKTLKLLWDMIEENSKNK